MNLKKIQNYFITKKIFNGAAIFIIVAYKLSENIQELFKGGEFIFSILNTISYSILASSGFYLIYEYFPKKANEEKSQILLLPLFENLMERFELFDYWFTDLIIFDNENNFIRMNEGQFYKNEENIKGIFKPNKDVANQINYIFIDLQILLNNPLLNNLDMRITFVLYELSILFSSGKILNDYESFLSSLSDPSLEKYVKNCKGLCDYIKEFRSYKKELTDTIKIWKK